MFPNNPKQRMSNDDGDPIYPNTQGNTNLIDPNDKINETSTKLNNMKNKIDQTKKNAVTFNQNFFSLLQKQPKQMQYDSSIFNDFIGSFSESFEKIVTQYNEFVDLYRNQIQLMINLIRIIDIFIQDIENQLNDINSQILLMFELVKVLDSDIYQMRQNIYNYTEYYKSNVNAAVKISQIANSMEKLKNISGNDDPEFQNEAMAMRQNFGTFFEKITSEFVNLFGVKQSQSIDINMTLIQNFLNSFTKDINSKQEEMINHINYKYYDSIFSVKLTDLISNQNDFQKTVIELYKDIANQSLFQLQNTIKDIYNSNGVKEILNRIKDDNDSEIL